MAELARRFWSKTTFTTIRASFPLDRLSSFKAAFGFLCSRTFQAKLFGSFACDLEVFSVFLASILWPVASCGWWDTLCVNAFHLDSICWLSKAGTGRDFLFHLKYCNWYLRLSPRFGWVSVTSRSLCHNEGLRTRQATHISFQLPKLTLQKVHRKGLYFRSKYP